MTDNRDKYKTTRKISFLFSFFLAVTITALTITLELNVSIASKQHLTNSIIQSNYTENAYDETKEKIEAYIGQKKLPRDILKGVVSKKRFYLDSSQSMERSLAGETSAVDTTDLETQLSKNIDSYLSSNKVEKSEAINLANEEIILTVSSYYSSGCGFLFGEHFYRMQQQVKYYLKFIVPCSAILIILTAVIIMRIQKYRHRGLRYISYSLLAALLSNLAFLIKFYHFEALDSNIMIDYHKQFAADFFQNGWNSAIVVAAVEAGIFVICIILANKHKFGKKAK